MRTITKEMDGYQFESTAELGATLSSRCYAADLLGATCSSRGFHRDKRLTHLRRGAGLQAI